MASIKAPATILHFTQADNVMASSDRIVIQTREETNRLPRIHRWSQVQWRPARLPCTIKRMNPGIQVIPESRIASTEDLPKTYSARENGRQKYKGNAPLARSGEIRPGPTKAVRR